MYEIRVKGLLGAHLEAWFEDLKITNTPEGDSLLTGPVTDQAALYGLIARCRDLGLTLISLNPIETAQGEKAMTTVHCEASLVIDATPATIYAVVTDYRVGHPAILPKPYFTDLIIEKGGRGAGSVLLTKLNVWGRKFTYHQEVTEPVPGRVIRETEIGTEQYTEFVLEPLDNGSRTRVTIRSEFPVGKGIVGFMDRLMQPSFVRRLYMQELNNLAAYVRTPASDAIRAR